MFERFTQPARQVVVLGQEEARNLGHSWIGTEHLLLGVLSQPQSPGVSVLTELGVTSTTCRDALRQMVGAGGWGASDADALSTLGINLDEVRSRAEAIFGPGALDPFPDPPPRRRGRRRRGRCKDAGLSGHLRFMPLAKRALTRAGDEALALGESGIGVEHVLLGLLDPQRNMAVDLLRLLGAEPEVVRARVLARLGSPA